MAKKPLRFNPYQPGKLVSPYMFFGRREEMRVIEQSLFQAKCENPSHFLIEGERGIGKSSLMMLAATLARGQLKTDVMMKFDFITLSIDVTGHQTQVAVIRSIARQLKQAIADRSVAKELVKRALDFAKRVEAFGVRFTDSQSTPDPDEWRDELVESLIEVIKDTGVEGVFIMIDEADKAGEDARLGEFLKLLSERLEMKGCSKVLFGLAGLPTTVANLKASHESAPRLFEIMRLEPLEVAERHQVLKKGLQIAKEKNGFETTITEMAADLISELSEGYPHFLQQFAFCAFAADDDDEITEDDVNEGANHENGALAQLGRKFFNEMYYGKVGSPEYRQVLNALAEHTDNWVPRKDIIEATGLPKTLIDNALRALKERNVILVDDTRKGKGFYRLPTKSFAAWINATKPFDDGEFLVDLFGPDNGEKS